MIILKISSCILNYQVAKYVALSAVSWKSLLKEIKQGTFQMIFKMKKTILLYLNVPELPYLKCNFYVTRGLFLESTGAVIYYHYSPNVYLR